MCVGGNEESGSGRGCDVNMLRVFSNVCLFVYKNLCMCVWRWLKRERGNVWRVKWSTGADSEERKEPEARRKKRRR